MARYAEAVVVLCLLASASALDWWQKEAIYQVYPISFKDSDGDGNGDIKGITQQHEYFKDVGVGIVWLSPIYKSPMKDMGYDVSNHTDINKIFGTLDDLKDLVKTLHDNGLKILLDLIPNHTSDEHPWFKDSLEKKNDKNDYYVWRKPRAYEGTKPLPPNNWQSIFGGSAWEYVKDRDEYYLHQFGSYQPDLNYNNSKVVDEMKDVMRFWLNIGVDGFRVDATPYLVETNYDRDEPKVENCNSTDPYQCLIHKYTKDQDGTYEIIKEFEAVLHEEDIAKEGLRVLFNEAYTTPEKTMKYYFNLSSPFNFNLMTISRDTKAEDAVKAITDFMDKKPANAWPNWVIGNHDNERIASKMGPDMVDAMNMLVTMLPGTSITYYGEEIGMTNTYIKPTERKDKTGRDPFRTPMQWNSDMNGGFSNSSKTWLPANPNYFFVNVEKQKADGNSHLDVYKKLLALHKQTIEAELKNGSVQALSDWAFGFKRGSHAVIVNLNNEEEVVKLDKLKLPSLAKVEIAAINSRFTEKAVIKTAENISMPPGSGIVLSLPSSSAGLQGTIGILLLSLIMLLQEN